ncbi:SsrA-binding protein SmpB [bacterium]|nr:MAG: SsrA-binding protein SmpB [bacterium]
MAKPYAYNRRARYDYEIKETLEAGISLKGYEVKAVKTGHCSLRGSFVVLKNERPYLLNSSIPPYQPKNTPKNYDPNRSRQLLLNKKEIRRLIGKTKEKGLTLIPIKMYNKKGRIKVEIGVGRGKRKIDKREKIKKRDIKREVDRDLRSKE